ncbi:MAG: hypothetical protein D6679_08220 [Candidatus Hydrogenedentota bacterium]|nr:MAG: hypothetical protein D6679_08220 [Candidatus Hydrogenedentota bacterium]
MERKRDLSILPRQKLLKAGLEAMAKHAIQDAMYYFGAAIRKARRIHLWDIEAEFYKFVTLYLEGDYREAVQRCIECLDGTKLMADAAAEDGVILPKEIVVNILESCLVQAMVMRGDSFFQMIQHFWRVDAGEYYINKRSCGLFSAIGKAWSALSLRQTITFDLLREELKPFSSYLHSQLESAKDILTEIDHEIESELDRDTQQSVEKKKELSAEQKEKKITAFLTECRKKGYLKLNNTDLDRLLKVCREAKTQSHFIDIFNLIDILGPNSKRPYLEALASNAALTAKDQAFTDRDAVMLQREVREFLEKRVEESE